MSDIGTMTTLLRLAMILGALALMAGALLASLLPATASTGGDCGEWFAPEFSSERTAVVLRDLEDSQTRATELGADDLATDSRDLARVTRITAAECADTLATRRLAGIGMGLGALVLAGLAPIGWGNGSPRPTDRNPPSPPITVP